MLVCFNIYTERQYNMYVSMLSWVCTPEIGINSLLDKFSLVAC